MPGPSSARHAVIHRDPFAYCAHAQAAVAADGSWLVVFNRAPRGPFVMHPPEEPLFRNVMIRSEDLGASWSAPQVVPGYDLSGTECASLTTLRDGTVLLNQWQFEWYPLGLARTLPDQSRLSYPDQFLAGWLNSPEHELGGAWRIAPEELAPWVRGGGRTITSLSSDNGRSFGERAQIDTRPFSGGYGMRGAVELADGTIVLPLSDVPNYRQVFTVHSHDGGRTWSKPFPAAAGEGHEFEEPAAVLLPSGRLLMVMRDNVTRRLHQCDSLDGGRSWSTPRELAVEGYPAHLLPLTGGRLLMTYGWRQQGYGIRAVLSQDEGRSWKTEETILIRGGLRNRNLGYPVTLRISDGAFFTIYYAEDEIGVTAIHGTWWEM